MSARKLLSDLDDIDTAIVFQRPPSLTEGEGTRDQPGCSWRTHRHLLPSRTAPLFRHQITLSVGDARIGPLH
jgi:hypothetical protein